MLNVVVDGRPCGNSLVAATSSLATAHTCIVPTGFQPNINKRRFKSHRCEESGHIFSSFKGAKGKDNLIREKTNDLSPRALSITAAVLAVVIVVGENSGETLLLLS